MHLEKFLLLKVTNFFMVVTLALTLRIPLATARTCDDLNTQSGAHHWTPLSNARASALIVHGLNGSASIMTDIEQMLHTLNVQTLKIELHGHRGNLDELKSTTKEHWVHDVLKGYCRLRLAQQPILYVGYSLGGLLGPYTLARDDGMQFDGMMLFAPALSVHWHLRFLHFFGKILPSDLIIPARTPEAYRMHRGVPVSTYGVFFEILSEFRDLPNKRPLLLDKRRIPGLVVIDSRDELISYSGVTEFIKKYDLTNHWSVFEIPSQQEYRHLIMDQTSMDIKHWQQIQDSLQSIIEIIN